MPDFPRHARTPEATEPAAAPGDPFARAVTTAFANARIDATLEGSSTVRVTLPGGGTAPLDLTPVLEHARTIPVEGYQDLADGFVRGVMRSFRRKGMLIGTHYPLPADDDAGHALQDAFDRHGLTGTFEEPNRVGVRLRGGGSVSFDIARYRAEAEPASSEERARLAEALAAETARDLARVESQREDLTSLAPRLRVRLYPDTMLEARLRDSVVTRELVPGLWETLVVDYPETIQPLQRGTVDQQEIPEPVLFRLAIGASLDEPFETAVEEPNGVRLLRLSGPGAYMAAHVHILGTYLESATRAHGALVAFPVPEVLLVHPLGGGHPVLALETLQAKAAEYGREDGAKPISGHVYWWRPRDHERLGEHQIPEEGHVPNLRPVRVEVDHDAKRLTLFADDDFHRVVAELTGA